MLPESVIQLLNGIYVRERSAEVLQVLRNNPEELLVSLLAEIEKDLHVVSATLAETVDSAAAGVIPSIKERRAEHAVKKERAKK